MARCPRSQCDERRANAFGAATGESTTQPHDGNERRSRRTYVGLEGVATYTLTSFGSPVMAGVTSQCDGVAKRIERKLRADQNIEN